MDAIILDTTASTFNIGLDRKFFTAKQVKQIVNWLQVEFLAQKVNFDPSIEALGEEIHENWWKNNCGRFEDIIDEAEKLDDAQLLKVKGGKRKKANP